MRLLCVEHKTVWGGGQVALTSLLREWQRTRVPIEATIVCPPGAALESRARAAGIQTVVFPLGQIEKNQDVGWNLAQRILPTVRLLATLRRSRTQIVLANGAFSFLASVFAAKLARVPIVWWEHNTTLPNNALVRRMMRWATRIVVVSDAIRQQFLALAPEAENKISVIYNGVDAERFKPNRVGTSAYRNLLGVQQKTLLVGTVSRLAPEKGVEFFVAAANQLAREFPGVGFLIAGDGPERAALQAQAMQAAPGANSPIQFLGMREDIPELLNALDVFVMPSRAEAFGIAVVEAMACALPVVASQVGGLQEIVVEDETGLLVLPGDAPALGSAIAALLRDENKRAAFGERGRARVLKHFTLAHQAQNWQMILDTVQSQTDRHVF